MSYNISNEVYVFLATMYGGMVIGLMYDLYRIFRRVFKPKKIATTIEDFIFWIAIAIVSVMVLGFSNDGQIRFYTFLGFFMGALLYNRVLSRFVIKSIMVAIYKLKKLCTRIFRCIVYPLKILKKKIVSPCFYWMRKRMRPIYYKLKRICALPKIMVKEIKKYSRLIRNKK